MAGVPAVAEKTPQMWSDELNAVIREKELEDLVDFIALLPKGFNINGKDSNDDIPYIVAVEQDIIESKGKYLTKSGTLRGGFLGEIDVNAKNNKGETALDKAFEKIPTTISIVKKLIFDTPRLDPKKTKIGKPAVIDFIIKNRFVNEKLIDGNTFLINEANEENLDTVETLLKGGADIKIRGKRKLPILQESLLTKNIDLVKLLVENGADVNEEVKDYTALKWALATQAYDIAFYLIKKMDSETLNKVSYPKGNINATLINICSDKRFVIPRRVLKYMLTVLKEGQKVKRLIPKNATEFVEEEIPILDLALVIAYKNEQYSTCKLLVEKGATPEARFIKWVDAGGLKGLYEEVVFVEAVTKKWWEVVRAFLDNGADPEILLRAKTAKKIKLDVLDAAKIGSTKLFDAMIRRRYKLDAVSDFGWTALRQAALNKNAELVKYLLDKNIDPNSFVGKMKYPLQISIEQKDFPSVVLLLEKTSKEVINGTNEDGLDKNYKANFLLYCAAMGYEMEDIAKKLIEKGGDVNRPNYDGQTPLNIALYKENTRVAKVLIDNGADIQKPNSSGITPLMLSVSLKQLPIIKLLMEKGANPDEEAVDPRPNINPNNNGLTARKLAREDPEIIAILDTKDTVPPLSVWKGYESSEISFFESLFENEQAMADISMCPICLTKVFRSEACMYMKHTCPTPLPHFGLHNRFKFGGRNDTPVQVCWCTLCGRSAANHQHFTGIPIRDVVDVRRKLPDLIDPDEGSSPFDKNCQNQGGGGFREKLGRILALAKCACKLQTQVNQITNWEARRILISAAWDSNQTPMTPDEYDTIMETKKFPLPEDCVLEKEVEVAAVPFTYPDVERPADEKVLIPIEYPGPDNNYCFVEGGKTDPDEQGKVPSVWGFQHKQSDGQVLKHGEKLNRYNEPEQRICGKDLEQTLESMNLEYTKGKCPISDDCVAKLYPEEIKGIVSEEFYEKYKAKFNEVNYTGPVGRGRVRTRRNKKRKGGAVPMTRELPIVSTKSLVDVKSPTIAAPPVPVPPVETIPVSALPLAPVPPPPPPPASAPVETAPAPAPVPTPVAAPVETIPIAKWSTLEEGTSHGVHDNDGEPVSKPDIGIADDEGIEFINIDEQIMDTGTIKAEDEGDDSTASVPTEGKGRRRTFRKRLNRKRTYKK